MDAISSDLPSHWNASGEGAHIMAEGVADIALEPANFEKFGGDLAPQPKIDTLL